MRDGGDSMRAMSTRRLATSGATDRGCQRIAAPIERTRLQRRQDEVPHELLARVDDVGADRASRQRALANVGQLSPLAEVERHRHDFSLVSLGQPRRSRPTCLRPAGVRQDDALFHL